MENLLETISLDMEEANDLAFKVQIEGATTPANVRLVCEGQDVSYMFKGHSSGDGVIEFTIPQMSNKIQEGLYMARVEVLVENRYFAPVQFQINFKKAVKVFAEAIRVNKPVLNSEVKVSAVAVQRTSPAAAKAQPAPKSVDTLTSKTPKKKLAESKGESTTFVDDSDSVKAIIRNALFSSKK